MVPSDVDQQLTGLAGLGDPIRRALYRHVVERGVPISNRDEAAHAAGISRPLAATTSTSSSTTACWSPLPAAHGSRRGPGAGRRPDAMSAPTASSSSACPPAAIAALAGLLARAVEADPSGAAKAALDRAAATLGAGFGEACPTTPRP